MGNRIIINNKTDLPDLDVIGMVQYVIKQGLISQDYGGRECYSLSTLFTGGYAVSCRARKNGFTFTVWHDSRNYK